jgi:predicted O-methyltransferase YrrM
MDSFMTVPRRAGASLTQILATQLGRLTRFLSRCRELGFRATLIKYLALPVTQGDKRASELFSRLEAAGLHVLPVGYYSPIPDTHELRSGDQRWRQEVDLSDVRFNFEEQRRLGESFKTYRREIADLPDDDELRRRGYGLGYGPIESMMLYSVIRHFGPKRIIEIGSGVSTVYEARAIAANKMAGRGPCALTCVEPYPSELLYTIPEVTDIVQKKVQELPIEFFRQLEPNDILFLDSSHSVKIGSDVNFLYLHILPRLRPGVLIQIHDIYFPFLTPPDDWLFDRLMFWQETVLLKALLSGNRNFEIIYCSSYLHNKEPRALSDTFDAYDPQTHYPVSIWLRTTDSNF